GYRNFTTKLWNAARFAEMNSAFGPEATEKVADIASFKPKATANRWIIGEVAKAREEVDEALSAYRFNDAAGTLYAFTWGKVCDWYLEFSKPLLNSDDAALVAETRATMNWVLDQVLILLHPFMPFITEELWSMDPARVKMLIHADWPEYTASDLLDKEADREMNWVIGLIEAVRSARMQMHVPAGLKIPVLQIALDKAGQKAWANNEALIRRMARIDNLSEATDVPKGAITVPVEGGTFALPLADIIDVDAEKARLEKTLGKLEKEIGGLLGRLNNPKFVESAPEAVVAEARDNLKAREEEAEKLKAAVARLKELS
ncbi:MAG TPA: valine--tRNA ligase, partial [Rhodobacteraceae bacterium]|nr:valine--tRNA ligase [Paracoccaceae bacterium]